MLYLIAIAVALLPFLIACVRNPGWVASIIIALCTVAVIVLAAIGVWGAAAAPWILSLLMACASTSGRERREKRQHAEVMKALAAKQAPAAPADVVDRFIASGS
jgi:hypothetical protein